MTDIKTSRDIFYSLPYITDGSSLMKIIRRQNTIPLFIEEIKKLDLNKVYSDNRTLLSVSCEDECYIAASLLIKYGAKAKSSDLEFFLHGEYDPCELSPYSADEFLKLLIVNGGAKPTNDQINICSEDIINLYCKLYFLPNMFLCKTDSDLLVYFFDSELCEMYLLPLVFSFL